MASITANTDLRRRFELDTELKDWIHFNGLTAIEPSGARETQPSMNLESERRLLGNGRRDRRDAAHGIVRGSSPTRHPDPQVNPEEPDNADDEERPAPSTTMTLTFKGVNAKGQAIHDVMVFEKR